MGPSLWYYHFSLWKDWFSFIFILTSLLTQVLDDALWKDCSTLIFCRKPLGIWCSEVCCVRPGMRWMLEVPCSWNTVMGRGLWARALATSLQQSLQKCRKYIFVFSGILQSSFMLPPFLYFSFGFLPCLTLHRGSFSSQNITGSCQGRNNQLLLRGIISASAQGKEQGEEAEIPLFPNTPLHIRNSKQSNSMGSVQHRCMALQFQMVFLVCPLCWDLCTNSFSFKYRFINI